MNHRHFKYIRNVIFILVALVMAGYPYLLYAGYIYRSDEQFITRSLLVVGVLLISFAGVAYFSHREYEKRRSEES